MGMFSSFNISGSALSAEKLRLDTVSSNLANMETTRTPEGGPYRRKTVVFAERLSGLLGAPSTGAGRGVSVAGIIDDPNPPRLEHDPGHPDADEEGYVEYPNIDLAKEMTDLITSSRSYEASSTAINTAKSLYLKALEIGRA